MNTTLLNKFIGTGVLLLLCGDLFATHAADVDKVQLKNSKVFVWQNGGAAEATADVTLPFDIVVKTNGTFTVNGGKDRKLQEGESLGRDGMLLKPDGTISPVMDHVSSSGGRIVVVKDGEVKPAGGAVQLGNGTTVDSDGKVIPRDGAPRKLLDGELYQLGGTKIPARDTVTMKGGKVSVQKDGATLQVDPARSIMMNDGTKVFGDGTIIRFSGEQSKIVEGQVLVLDGVVVRTR